MTTSPLSPRPDPFLGRVLKETYHLDRKLDEGGAGAVYIGTHLGTDRTIAVKTLQGLQQASQDVCVRFFHEARILSKLHHPNIVDLLDFDFTPEGLPFLVMAYMEGCTLDAFVPEDGLPLRDVVAFMQQILEGVGAAHEARLIHRDLSPFNLFVADPSGSPTIKVLNFGLAKALNDSGAKTLGDGAFGHPSYMSPEHFRNFEGLDTRADIFSLGAILHFLITGREPFAAPSFSGAMAKVLSGQKPAAIDFEALGKPEAAVLEPILRRALDPEPVLRYASTEEMRRAMADAVGKLASPARPTSIRDFLRRPRLRSVATFAMGASPLLLLTGGFLAWHLSQPVVPSPRPAAASPEQTSRLAFEQRLDAVVRSRDGQALLDLLSPEARTGGAPGPEGARAVWHPEQADAGLWKDLDDLLAQGPAFPSPDRIEFHRPQGPQGLWLTASRAANGAWRIDALYVAE